MISFVKFSKFFVITSLTSVKKWWTKKSYIFVEFSLRLLITKIWLYNFRTHKKNEKYDYFNWISKNQSILSLCQLNIAMIEKFIFISIWFRTTDIFKLSKMNMSRKFDIYFIALFFNVNKISSTTKFDDFWLQNIFTTRTFMRTKIDKFKKKMRFDTWDVWSRKTKHLFKFFWTRTDIFETLMSFDDQTYIISKSRMR